MILYRSHLADAIKQRHTHDSHSEEDVEHILLAYLFLDGRHQRHKDEGWQRAQAHEERHFDRKILGCSKHGYQDWNTCRYTESTHICHEHTYRGENGNLVCIAGQRRVQGSVRYIDQCIEHRQTYVCYVSIDELDGFCLSLHTIPEAEDGKYSERQTRQDEIRTILTPTWIMLIYISSHQWVPEYIDQANHQEHGGSHTRIESVDIGVEEQQIHTDGLVDEVLRQVSRSESDAL